MDEDWVVASGSDLLDAQLGKANVTTDTGAQDTDKILTPVQYLSQFISVEDSAAVISALGTEALEDFKCVDKAMAEEATSSLKLIPRKKAIEALLKASFPVVASSDDGISEKVDKPLVECVVLAIDRSGSMGTEFEEQQAWCDDGNASALQKSVQRRSRMDAVKQVFYAFRDRTETLTTEIRHDLGLLQFDDKIEVLLELTPSLDLFEEFVDKMQQRGSTAIYTAISEACSMLKPVFDQDPGIDLRVVVLTDGQNNAGIDPLTALEAANGIGVVVDAIIVGNSPDENLRRIVSATEGCCFQVKSLSEAFELMEAEAVVSLKSRRGGLEKPAFVQRPLPKDGFSSIGMKSLTSGRNTSTVIQKTAPRPDSRIVTCEFLSTSDNLEKCDSSIKGGNIKRIKNEIRDLANGIGWLGTGEGCHIFIDMSDISIMKALITGPEDSPFAEGTFVLNIICSHDYPFKPPKVMFETPVHHCNVCGQGHICIDILRDNWSLTLSIGKVVETIRLYLSNPNPDSAMRQWIAEETLMHIKSGGTDTRYYDAAKAATRANASKSVDEWKAEWGI